MTKRHPHDKEKRQQFDAEGMKKWRIKLADGSAKADDFLIWLEQFK